MHTLSKALFLSALFSVLVACSDGNDRAYFARPVLSLDYTSAPIDLAGTSVRYAEDVRYGQGERNLFDIYLPDCDDPTPLVIYIHGGGFTGGDKSGSHEQNADAIREFMDNCVAYATINYFLLTIPTDEDDTPSMAEQGGVLTSMMDAARALQFMRYHYESLNLEPENVALYGGSAGAGTSLWLGNHDDMADPANDDPVLRESTRVKAVGALATQSTYDLLRWEAVFLPFTEQFEELLGGTDIPTLAAAVGATDYMLTFLGINSVEEIESPENVAYRANIDMLGLMDSSDAPIYVHNFTTGLDNLLDLFLHHALHGLAVKDRADEVGLHSVAYSSDPDYPLEDPSGEGLTSFLIRHIQ